MSNKDNKIIKSLSKSYEKKFCSFLANENLKGNPMKILTENDWIVFDGSLVMCESPNNLLLDQLLEGVQRGEIYSKNGSLIKILPSLHC